MTSQDCAGITRPFLLPGETGGGGGAAYGRGLDERAFVECLFRDLGLDATWMAKGNRQDQTQPVARLRAMCQQLGLLRKHEGRLLQIRLARSTFFAVPAAASGVRLPTTGRSSRRS